MTLQDTNPPSWSRTTQLAAWRVALESTVVTSAAFILLLAYFSQRTFLDEFDNMIGGNVVAHGGAIYVDFLSQHTPLAYWISALGHLFGAEYFGGQRIWGYFVFAILLGAIYARNVRSFGRVPLLVVALGVPMLHAFNPELSYAVLSDNYQAIAYVAIIFDVVAIGLLREHRLSRWVSFGLASALAIGVAFVAVYFVAGALVVTSVLVVVDQRSQISGWRRWLTFVSTRAGVFVAPFALLLAALAATGALRGAYEQAFVLNREYYSKYLLGFGSDAISPLYTGFFDFASRFGSLPGLYQTDGLIALRNSLAFAVLVAAIVVFTRLRLGLGLGLLWMAALCATRGWDGFHAQPFWAFIMTCVGLLAWITLGTLRNPEPARRWTGVSAAVALGLLALVVALPYARMVWDIRSSLTTPVAFPNPARTQVIKAIVPEGESYGELNVNNAYDFVVTRRLPAGGFAGVVPWFGDMLDTQMAAKLSADNPVLIFNDPQNDVWGYTVADHIPDVLDVVRDHYTEVDMSDIGLGPGTFLRNDALLTALSELQTTFPQAQFRVLSSNP